MSKNKKKEPKKNKKRRFLKHPILAITSAAMAVIAISTCIFFYYQIYRYEKGVVDVCATQQDAYVQLVLDQINLQDDTADEEIITNILGTLDSSSNKYWTFSRNQSMLYVKDVLETNKYKDVTAASYYETDSAKAFLENLQVNKVSHAEIEIGDSSYIASGVSFEYNDNNYRLCLLTSKSVLLDNNKYLGAKTQMWTGLIVVLILLVLISMTYAHHIRKMQFIADDYDETTRKMNANLLKMNERLADHDLHDTRSNLWKQEAFTGFADKLARRKAYPFTIIHMHCENKVARDEFLKKSTLTLNKNVLRFEYGENDLLLLFVQIDKENAMQSLMPLWTSEVYLSKGFIVDEKEADDLYHIYLVLKLYEEVELTEEEKQSSSGTEKKTDGN